jgi:hypothetical protein
MATRTFFERRFGAGLSQIRVHTGERAAETARSLKARAYTSGDDVVFGRGEYNASTAAGKRLLAHELTHSIQQRGRSRVLDQHDSTGHSRPVVRQFTSGYGDALQREEKTVTATSPLSYAVKILKEGGKKGIGTSVLSTSLVRGIIRAEKRFMGVGGKIAEFLGFGDTRGPGQIGEPAVKDVDRIFGDEIALFAEVYSGPPSTWEDKVTDPNWSYFYIAAYLANSIWNAQDIYEVSDRDSTINYGIAMYHGAHPAVKKYRRDMTTKLGIDDLTKITWQMVVDEVEASEMITVVHSHVHIPKIVNIVNYVHEARGWPDVKVKMVVIPTGPR